MNQGRNLAIDLKGLEAVLAPLKIDAKTGTRFFEFKKSDHSTENEDKKNSAAEKWGKNMLDPTHPLHLVNMPDELLLTISANLAPHDALDFLTSCKRMTRCVKSDNNEISWKTYCDKWCPSHVTKGYKKRFLIESR